MKTVAIIDDDEPMRLGLAGLVRSLGYDCSTFASAREFLDRESGPAVACLITDVQMPGMTGIQLQQVLRQSGVVLPVIFITAFPDDLLLEMARDAGAFAFFSKPFKAEALALRLAEACGGD